VKQAITFDGYDGLLTALKRYHSDSEVLSLLPMLDEMAGSDIPFALIEGDGEYGIFPEFHHGSSPIMMYSPGELTTWNSSFEPSVLGYDPIDTLGVYANVEDIVEKQQFILNKLGIKTGTHSIMMTGDSFDSIDEKVA